MFRIAHLSFDSPFILAPLAGYSDLPFRLLCRRFGAGYCVSEMISCHGLVHRQEKTLRMLDSVAEEKPVSFQLFGADATIMGQAAAIAASHQPEMIDINMGCPVKKVTKKGAGAALMTTPRLAADIITRVCRSVQLPVTVKIRAGKNSANINCAEIARIAEDCGAAAIAVHGRTWAQGFSGKCDPEVIGAVKRAVSIPVIGNGDITSVEQGLAMRSATGCDGIMIGRAAMGNPWIFAGQQRPAAVAEIAKVALEHLGLIERYLQGKNLLGYLKNQMSRYFKGAPGCSLLRQQIFSAAEHKSLRELLEKISLNQPMTIR